MTKSRQIKSDFHFNYVLEKGFIHGVLNLNHTYDMSGELTLGYQRIKVHL